MLKQRGRVSPISTAPVTSNLTGRRGIGDQRAPRRIDRREAAGTHRPRPCALEGVVATGVEDDDARRIVRPFHDFNDQIERQRRVLGSNLIRDICVYSGEIIVPSDLHAVTGEIE
ncbi:hypothetical protein D9M70_462430 [compost metagenome]